MKMIRALIKPFRLDDVRNALVGAGVQGMTVLEVRAFGPKEGRSGARRESECDVDLAPEYEVEVAVADASVDEVVSAISTAATNRKTGNGKIFVSSIDQALRIRTGETGSDAL